MDYYKRSLRVQPSEIIGPSSCNYHNHILCNIMTWSITGAGGVALAPLIHHTLNTTPHCVPYSNATMFRSLQFVCIQFINYCCTEEQFNNNKNNVVYCYTSI